MNKLYYTTFVIILISSTFLFVKLYFSSTNEAPLSIESDIEYDGRYIEDFVNFINKKTDLGSNIITLKISGGPISKQTSEFWRYKDNDSSKPISNLCTFDIVNGKVNVIYMIDTALVDRSDLDELAYLDTDLMSCVYRAILKSSGEDYSMDTIDDFVSKYHKPNKFILSF